MKRAIETRESITVVSGGVRLQGTYHRPARPAMEEKRRVGVLFPNSGVLPRAAGGDAAVYWADWLAASGYPSFRFDLPGLGDSDRDPAAEGIDFQAHADAGGYAPWLAAIASDLVERFNLAGVIVVGHCSGAVTALFAAAATRRIVGLILLDPYFHVQQDSEVQTALNNWNKRVFRSLDGGWAARLKLREAGVKVLSGLRKIYHRLNGNRLLVRRKKLPGSANLPLIRCWNQLASAGVPMLILRSPSYAPKAGGFDYIDYLQRRSPRGSCMSLEPVEGASHAFAERQSREAVGKCTERWLQACFPIPKCTGVQDSEPQAAELANAILGTDRNVR